MALHHLEKGKDFSSWGDAPQAFSHFLKVLEACPHDSLFLEEAHRAIGTLYYNEGLHERAAASFKEAIRYSISRRQEARNQLLLGKSFAMSFRSDSALACLLRADGLAGALGDCALCDSISTEIAAVYIEDEAYEEAERYVGRGKGCAAQLNNARYYQGLEQPDSARFYFRQLLRSPGLAYRIEASGGLAEIAADQEAYDSALYYRNLQVMHRQAKSSADADLHLQKLGQLYDYIRKEQEFNHVRQEAAVQKFLLVAAMVLILLAVAMFLWYRERSIRRQKEKEIKISNLKRMEEETRKKSQLYIENLNAMIGALEGDIARMKDSQDNISRELLEARRALMQKDVEQAEALHEMERKAASSLVNSEVYKRIAAPSYRMREPDWEELSRAIDYSYPHFTDKLNELYSFKPTEFRLCLLLKAEIRLSRIADLLLTSKQNVSSMRKRLYKKVLREDEAPESWDHFVRNL